MLPQVREDVLKRLRYIEGHLQGIRKMVEEEKYCVDVMKQTYAVRRALEKAELMVLDGHLNSCVLQGVRDGREKEVFKELVELYGLASR